MHFAEAKCNRRRAFDIYLKENNTQYRLVHSTERVILRVSMLDCIMVLFNLWVCEYVRRLRESTFMVKAVHVIELICLARRYVDPKVHRKVLT